MVAWFSCFENDATNAYPNPLHDVANIPTCVVQVSWAHVLQIKMKNLKPIAWFSCFKIDAINTFPNLLHAECKHVCKHFVFNSIGLSSDSSNDGQSTQQTSKTFLTMLKLISGALIGGVNYKEIYMDSDIDDKTNPLTTTNNMGVDQNEKVHKN
jgi:hypothetical protein